LLLHFLWQEQRMGHPDAAEEAMRQVSIGHNKMGSSHVFLSSQQKFTLDCVSVKYYIVHYGLFIMIRADIGGGPGTTSGF
jgi:hypothetical protein